LTTLITIVTGTGSAQREAAIAARIDPRVSTAIVLEGLPSGNDPFATLPPRPDFQMARIAPGCPCCMGNLTLRVTLNRMLRRRPQQIYLGVSDKTHLGALCSFLSNPPYDTLLRVTEVLDAGHS
jgi:hypothetical protein